MEHFHIVAIAADFLIEVISGMQAVGEYGVSILRAVVQYPLAAVQGSVDIGESPEFIGETLKSPKSHQRLERVVRTHLRGKPKCKKTV